MSTVDLPNIREPFIDTRSGQISRPWWIWLQQLMTRVGGSNGTDLAALQAAVTALIVLTREQGNEISGLVPLPPDTDSALTLDDGMVYMPPQDLAVTSPVLSVFGRVGAVTAQSGDYTVGQVTNAASVLLTLAQFAATTSAQLAGVISDETGSGALVFGSSPTLTAPVIASIVNTGTLTLPTSTDTLVGRATTDTLTNKTLTSPTVNTPTISGGTINNASIGATTASSGRFTDVTVTTGGVGITGGLTMSTGAITPVSTQGIAGTTTNNNANAGSWGEYQNNSASGVALTTGTPANLTSVSLSAGDWDVEGIAQFSPAATTTVSQILAGISSTSATFGSFDKNHVLSATLTTGASQTIPTPAVRMSLASTTTIYLVGQAAFATSTMTASGFIRARRVR